MPFNEAETRFHLIDPLLRGKGYDSLQHIKLETPAPVELNGSKGRRSKRPGRTDYLLCVQVGDMPKPLPVAVLEAKKKMKTRSRVCSRPTYNIRSVSICNQPCARQKRADNPLFRF